MFGVLSDPDGRAAERRPCAAVSRPVELPVSASGRRAVSVPASGWRGEGGMKGVLTWDAAAN